MACSAESTSASEASTVELRVTRAVSFGQSIKAVGSTSQMGSWSVGGAMQLTWSEGDVWHGTVPLPPGVYNFKFVVARGDEAIAWEQGANRVVEVPAERGAIEMVCSWDQTSTSETSFTSLKAAEPSVGSEKTGSKKDAELLAPAEFVLGAAAAAVPSSAAAGGEEAPRQKKAESSEAKSNKAPSTLAASTVEAPPSAPAAPTAAAAAATGNSSSSSSKGKETKATAAAVPAVPKGGTVKESAPSSREGPRASDIPLALLVLASVGITFWSEYSVIVTGGRLPGGPLLVAECASALVVPAFAVWSAVRRASTGSGQQGLLATGEWGSYTAVLAGIALYTVVHLETGLLPHQVDTDRVAVVAAAGKLPQSAAALQSASSDALMAAISPRPR